MKKIDTIIFDWAGVFCSPGELFSHTRLLKTVGLTAAQMEQRVKPVQNAYYRGKISGRAFWRHVFKEFDIAGFTFKELNDAYLASYRPYPEILRLPSKLKPRYTVALLSNLTEDMMRHVVKMHELRPKFHRLFFSNREGRLKPELELMYSVLRALKAKPATTLFIDDSKNNIVAAKALGIHTLHVKTPKRLIADLRRMNLL